MPFVIISAAPYTDGSDIAARVAERLGYPLIGRELLAAAAQQHGLPEDRLRRAIDETPGWRTMSARERKACIAAIAATLSERVLDGASVCSGLAAHLYVTGISHVLKVRVTDSLDARAARAEQQGLARARSKLAKHDAHRRRWARALFSVDEDDPSTFDLVVDRRQAPPEEAVERIVEAAGARRYQPMSYSLQQAANHALANRVRALIADVDPDAEVVADDDGRVTISSKARSADDERPAELQRRAAAAPGVTAVEVRVVEDFFARAATSMR